MTFHRCTFVNLSRRSLVLFLKYLLMLMFFSMCMCTICVPGAYRGEKSMLAPKTGVMDDCDASCGCWKLNTSPLEEQPVF